MVHRDISDRLIVSTVYGAYSDWMIHKLGGLETTLNASSTGWRHIIVAPDIHAVARLRAGGFSLRTRFGLAAVSWAFATKRLTTNVTVPVGSTAEIVHMRDVPAVAATGATCRRSASTCAVDAACFVYTCRR